VLSERPNLAERAESFVFSSESLFFEAEPLLHILAAWLIAFEIKVLF
jgi:hypothetical protein